MPHAPGIPAGPPALRPPCLDGSEHRGPAPDGPCPWGSQVSGSACVIERSDGTVSAGRLLRLDGARREITFREPADKTEIVLPMDELRMLILTAVLPPNPADAELYRQPGADRPVLQVYALNFHDGRRTQGVTLGHAERAHGHYLVRPAGRDGGVVRIFVPRSACTSVCFQADRRKGNPRPMGSDVADASWSGPVRDEAQLRLALLAQASTPLRLTGEILVEMGLITPGQLAEVLAGQQENPGLRVGERLVAAGYLKADDLRMALRCKLGYALVDLRRFPLDLALLRQLPVARAVHWQVLPVMRCEQGVVVAMADPDDQEVLGELRFLYQSPILPVLPWGEVMDLLVSATYARHRLNKP